MSDRDVTHSNLVEIAKRNGDFRKNYGLIVGAFDKCCSASVVFLANFDSKYRSCVGLMVAVNKTSKMPRKMNVGLLAAKAVLRYWSCCNASSSMTWFVSAAQVH